MSQKRSASVLCRSGVWTFRGNPNGIASHSPRVAVLGYLGLLDCDWSQPQTGLRPAIRMMNNRACPRCNGCRRPQPLQGCKQLLTCVRAVPLPKVAEYGNSGLRNTTPSGLKPPAESWWGCVDTCVCINSFSKLLVDVIERSLRYDFDDASRCRDTSPPA